jgi:hypothetical protein
VLLKDWVELGLRGAVAVSLFTYIVGLLIVNFHLGRYGMTDFGLLRAEYLFAGSIWLFLVVWMALAIRWAKVEIGTKITKWKSGKKKAVRLFNLIAEAFAFVLAPLIPLPFLTGDGHALYHWKAWYGALVLAGTGLGLLLLFRTVSAVVHPAGKLLPDQPFRWFGPLWAVYALLVFIGVYAYDVFPFISPIFGGGQLRSVQLIAKIEQLTLFKVLGVEIHDDRITQPLALILETDDSLTLLPPRKDGADKHLKAILVKKTWIDAILYLDSKPDW